MEKSLIPNGEKPCIQEDFKVPVNEPIRVLAGFFSLFVEVGVVAKTNKQALFRLASKSISTPKSKELNPRTFHGRFYKVKLYTWKRIREILHKMLDEVNKRISEQEKK